MNCPGAFKYWVAVTGGFLNVADCSQRRRRARSISRFWSRSLIA